MPKLPDRIADQADEQESSGYSALPEGIYVCVLDQVDDTDKNGRPLSGQAGPYWSWQFSVAPGQKYAGRKLWATTSLADSALWKLKEVFNAFGYDTHTDTDELVGQSVKLVVTQRPIERGQRMGEIGNNVDRVLPYEEGEPVGDPELSEEPF